VDAPLVLYTPPGQSVQDVAPPGLYLPAPHLLAVPVVDPAAQ
jgi:hypothetical protein